MLKEIRKEIEEYALQMVIHRSILCCDITFQAVKEIIESCRPRTILEIGTYNGVSALVFARFPFVKKVWTIDVMRSPIVARLRRHLDHERKIAPLAVSSDREKGYVIDAIDADLAFVDGNHTYEGVSFDISLITPRFKSILFHDAKNPGVKKALDELSAKGEYIVSYKYTFALARRIK